MGFTSTAECDRCTAQVDCDGRQHIPKDWEEFGYYNESTGHYAYYVFCPTCANLYRHILDDIKMYESAKVNKFFIRGNNTKCSG